MTSAERMTKEGVIEKSKSLCDVHKRRQGYPLNFQKRNPSLHVQESEKTFSEKNVREAVQSALQAIRMKSLREPPPTLSKDIETLSRTISSVFEATKQEILTEQEAESVIEWIVGKFIERRFDRLMYDTLTIPGIEESKKWFVYKSSLAGKLE